MLSEDFTPNFFHNSWIIFDANWGPQSEMICSGRPVHFQTLSRNMLAVCSAVMVLLHEVTMVALLNLSTVTNRLSNPLDMGRSVIKSMVMFVHTPDGV